MTHARYVRLGVGDINGFLALSLVPHLGPGAMSGNYIDVIATLVESALYPYINTTGYEPLIDDLSSNYGLDTDVARDIIGNTQPLVMRMINTSFRPLIGECVFDVTMEPGGTILIENLGFINDQKQSHQFWEMDAYAQSIKDSMDSGDYVPERMRRAAGF